MGHLVRYRSLLTDFRISDLLFDCNTLICNEKKQNSEKGGGVFTLMLIVHTLHVDKKKIKRFTINNIYSYNIPSERHMHREKVRRSKGEMR